MSVVVWTSGYVMGLTIASLLWWGRYREMRQQRDLAQRTVDVLWDANHRCHDLLIRQRRAASRRRESGV